MGARREAHPLCDRVHRALRMRRNLQRHERSVDDAHVVRAVDLQRERIDDACEQPQYTVPISGWDG